MRHAISKRWKNLFRPLAGHSQVERIGTHVDFPWPFDCTFARHANPLKLAGLFPSGKNAATNELRYIDHATFAVVELQLEPKARQRFCR